MTFSITDKTDKEVDEMWVLWRAWNAATPHSLNPVTFEEWLTEAGCIVHYDETQPAEPITKLSWASEQHYLAFKLKYLCS